MDYWSSNDSVSMPPVLSDLVIENLGTEVDDAFFQEDIELNNVPGTILQYVVDMYNDPTSMDMYDIIVEDSLLAGTAFDSGNLFNFSTFDPCYSSTNQSATAATDGGAVGAVQDCEDLVSSTSEVSLNNLEYLNIYPNPVTNFFNLQFNLNQRSDIELIISHIGGHIIQKNSFQSVPKGKSNFSVTLSNRVPSGTFILSLRHENGIISKKILVHQK
jgi:hypothetical protein